MREILFRAKKKYGNGWCYGIPITEEHNTYKTGEFVMANAVNYDELANFEASYYFVPIKRETIGQYTGLNDKNGKRIFEGDILRHIDYPDEPMQLVWYVNGYALKGLWMDGEWPKILSKIEVAGNIHDNPELLKEGK